MIQANEDFESTPAINQLTIDARKIQLRPFRSLALAYDCADRMQFPNGRLGYGRVIMGDCPWYWVVTPADSELLVRAGYEMARRP